jgi:hypothetical protein
MVAPVAHPAALHPLTPGSPAYALLKLGAVGSIFALRFVLLRRSKAKEVPPPARRDPHPVSKKKKRRRRR